MVELSLTYTKNSVDYWIITTVTHCKPMTAKENHVDVSIPEMKNKLIRLIMLLRFE